MGRPRKDEEGPLARERIVAAFWGLLGAGPYANITIRGLCREAGVNPNTFYAYFGCMDELAEAAFSENLLPGFPAMVMGLVAAGDPAKVAELANDPDLARRFGRILLYARSGSPMLAGLVRDAMRGAWLASAGRAFDDLSREERADVVAVVGAQMALLSSTEPPFGTDDLAAFAMRPLGQAMVSTVAAMRKG